MELPDNPESNIPKPESLSDEEIDRLDTELGCFIRSIESITGQKASREEKLARIKQVQSGPDRFDIREAFGYNPELYKRKKEELRVQDEKNQLELLENIKKTDSPLGQALREFTIEGFQTAGIRDFMKMVEEGKMVALTQPYHIFHFGKHADAWSMLSDDNQLIEGIEDIDPLEQFKGLVFNSENNPTQHSNLD